MLGTCSLRFLLNYRLPVSFMWSVGSIEIDLVQLNGDLSWEQDIMAK